MSRRIVQGSMVAMMVCTVVYTGLASGFRNPLDGASSLGRSGGRVADVDDASAVSINPANMAMLKEPEAQIGVTFVDSSVEFTLADGRSSDTKGDVSLLPNVFAVLPLVGDVPLTLGVALTTPWGQSTEWSESSAVATVAPYEARMTTINLNPSVAGRVGQHVLVGAGVDILNAELDLKQWLALAPGAPLTHARLKGDGYGVGGNVGVTVELPKRQRVAAAYRSPVKVDLEGDTEVSGFTGPLFASSDFESEIEFPQSVVVGYSVGVTPTLRVAADAEWVGFSSFDELPLDLGANTSVGVFPSTVPQDWEDAWNYGVGLAWSASDMWTLRGGCVYFESPIPEETLAPTLPDADRWAYTAGIGCEAGANTLDLAYVYSEYDREVDTSLNPAYVGEYDVAVQLMQVSYSRRF